MHAASASFPPRTFTTITVHKSLTNTARSAARSGAGSIGKNAGIPKKNRKRLIITEIDDSLLRMELILRALGKIRASVLRKRKKIQESEYRDFGNNDVSV